MHTNTDSVLIDQLLFLFLIGVIIAGIVLVTGIFIGLDIDRSTYQILTPLSYTTLSDDDDEMLGYLAQNA